MNSIVVMLMLGNSLVMLGNLVVENNHWGTAQEDTPLVFPHKLGLLLSYHEMTLVY